MCQGNDGYKREEFYVQKFGNKRIIQVIGWTDEAALIYDLKCDLKYPMAWDVFFMHHEKLPDYELSSGDYGPDLQKLIDELTGTK